ncbi:hypothetical protein ACHAXN_009127 [Cyclotella atomus]
MGVIRSLKFSHLPILDASKSSKSGSSKSTKEHTSRKSSKSNNSNKSSTEPKQPVSSLTCQSLRKKKLCKKVVLCQWNKDVRMCLPRSNPVPNICLNEQEDMYRTCFQRAKDPSNDLTQDTILRDEYNNGTIAPFTKPYVTSDEELTYETIYLSPVRDDDSTLDCYEKFRLEEISLMWLKDSLGGPSSFELVCAFNDGYDLHKEEVVTDDGSSWEIETASLK